MQQYKSGSVPKNNATANIQKGPRDSCIFRVAAGGFRFWAWLPRNADEPAAEFKTTTLDAATGKMVIRDMTREEFPLFLKGLEALSLEDKAASRKFRRNMKAEFEDFRRIADERTFNTELKGMGMERLSKQPNFPFKELEY